MRYAKTLTISAAIFVFFVTAVPAAAKYDAEIDAPEEVKEICEKYGAEYNISPEFLEAICWNESRYLPEVASGSCKGIMQINEPVHRKRMEALGAKDIFDVDDNIHTGADYLAELFKEHEDPAAVLGLYHGEKNAISKANTGKYSGYVSRILEKAACLERLHGK